MGKNISLKSPTIVLQDPLPNRLINKRVQSVKFGQVDQVIDINTGKKVHQNKGAPQEGHGFDTPNVKIMNRANSEQVPPTNTHTPCLKKINSGNPNAASPVVKFQADLNSESNLSQMQQSKLESQKEKIRRKSRAFINVLSGQDEYVHAEDPGRVATHLNRS